MEDQAAHQAPPIPYARPQQPTDSPAASLPTETLTHILDLALQGLKKPLERQQMRIAISNVCKHWWTVAASERELVVQGSKQAGRLAEALLHAETSERQEAVKSLVLGLDAITDRRDATPAGDLLLCCPKLERLTLTFTEGLAADSKYRILGKHLRDSIGSCDTLEELQLFGRMSMQASEFDGMMRLLSRLSKLIAPSIELKATWDFKHSVARTGLEVLQIRISGYTTPKDVARSLIKSSLPTLKIARLALLPKLAYDSEGIAETLLPAASQLVELELPSRFTWTYQAPQHLPLLLSSLSSIRTLSMGPYSHNFGGLFDLLATLHALEEFTLTLIDPHSLTWGPNLSLLRYTDALKYVTTATRLRSIILPAELLWINAERKEIKGAAALLGVDMCFA